MPVAEELEDLIEWARENAPTSGVCGRVWQRDELAYKCRTCERDPTCAVCVDCFRGADHEGHDYAIIRTGGGCCDCGDGQAWKETGFCRSHGGASSEDEDPAASMDKAKRSEITRVVSLAGQDVVSVAESLVMDPSQSRCSFVQPKACWLLQKLMELAQTGDAVNRVTSLALLSTVNSDGECWLAKMQVLEATGPGFSKDFTSALHALYYQLITDLVFKGTFLRLFSRNYGLFINSMINQRRELSYTTETESNVAHRPADDGRGEILDSFSVQLFTVPVLVPVMIKEGLLDQMLYCLVDVVQLVSSGSPPTLDFDTALQVYESVLWRVVFDLRYVLTHKEVARYLILENQELFNLFLESVSFLQGMGGVHREVGPSAREFDSDTWAVPFTWEIEFYHLFELLLVGFKSEEKTSGAAGTLEERIGIGRNQALQTLQRKVFEWIRTDIWGFESTESNNRAIDALSDFSIVDRPASLHLPLHRFLAYVGRYLISSFGVEPKDILVYPEKHAAMDASVSNSFLFGHHLLLCQALVAQVEAGMWRRNGTSVQSSAALYRSVFCTEWFVDLDIFGLQLVVGASEEEGATLNGQMCLMTKSYCEDDTGGWSEDSEFKVAEAVLRLLVAILTDRCQSGLDDAANLRRRLIHRLCLGDHTHSGLLKVLPRRFSSDMNKRETHEQSKVEAIIQDIAEFTEAQDMEQGRYSLKDHCWKEFDPFNMHYSMKERSAAEQRFSDFCSKTNWEYSLFPFRESHRLPLYDGFEGLNSLSRSSCESTGLVHLCLATFVSGLENESEQTVNKPDVGILAPSLFIVKLVLENQAQACLSAAFIEEAQSRPDFLTRPSALFSKLLAMAQKEQCVWNEEYLSSINALFGLLAKRDFSSKQVLEFYGFPFSAAPISAEQMSRDLRMADARKRQKEAIDAMQKKQKAFLETLASNSEEQPDFEEENQKPAVTKTCAICREDEARVDHMGLIGFAQRSKVLYNAFNPPQKKLAIQEDQNGHDSEVTELFTSLSQESTIGYETGGDHSTREWPKLLDRDSIENGIGNSASVHVGFCGHHMHLSCFEGYFSSLLLRRIRRLRYEGDHLARVGHGEFLCPICRRLSNVLLPLFQSTEVRVDSGSQKPADGEFAKWYQCTVTRFDQKPAGQVELEESNYLATREVANNSLDCDRVLGHANGILWRLNLENRHSAGNRGEPPFVDTVGEPSNEVIQNRIGWLWSAALSTVSDLELASRLSSMTKEVRAFQCASSLLQTARAQGNLDIVGENDRRDIFGFACLGISSGIAGKPMDPFTALFLMTMSFPGVLSKWDVDNLCKICVNSVLSGIRATVSAPSIQHLIRYLLLFLRRALIARSCLLGSSDWEDLEPECTSTAAEAGQLVRLGGHFGIAIAVDTRRLETSSPMSSADLDDFLPLEPSLKTTGPSRVLEIKDARPLVAPSLVELPPLFQRLLEEHENALCCECNSSTSMSMVCLVCGNVVCGRDDCGRGQSPGGDDDDRGNQDSSEFNSSSRHAEKCGAGVGIFLILKQAVILLERDGRSCIWGSPYLDEHGEEDVGLRRGKSLWLSRERYSMLNKLWVTHGLDENSVILSRSFRAGGGALEFP